MKRITTLAVLALAVPLAAQQRTITCASLNNQQQVCPANTRDGVLLVREQSSNVCRQGQTWSYDRRGITVSGGCSAEFLTNDRRSGGYGNGNNGGSGYGNNNGYGNGPDVDSYHQYNGSQPPTGAANGYGAPNGRAAVLPQGTQIAMRLDQTVRLNELNQGDVVTGTVAQDVTSGGQIVIPTGSAIQAKVNSAQGAPLDLRLDSVTANGRTYTLQSNSVRGIRDAVATADGDNQNRGFSGVLSGLANAGTLPSGTVFNFRLTAAARAQ